MKTLLICISILNGISRELYLRMHIFLAFYLRHKYDFESSVCHFMRLILCDLILSSLYQDCHHLDQYRLEIMIEKNGRQCIFISLYLWKSFNYEINAFHRFSSNIAIASFNKYVMGNFIVSFTLLKWWISVNDSMKWNPIWFGRLNKVSHFIGD